MFLYHLETPTKSVLSKLMGHTVYTVFITNMNVILPTTKCKAAIQSRRQVRNKLKKHPLTSNFVEYCYIRAEAQWAIKSAKRKSWHNFVFAISSFTPTEHQKDKSVHIRCERLAMEKERTYVLGRAQMDAVKLSNIWPWTKGRKC